MTVEWNRTVTEVVWESQTAPGITWTTVVGGTSSGGGVTVHNDLSGRSAADAHPMSAITDLEPALTDIATAVQAQQGDIGTLQTAVAGKQAADADLTAIAALAPSDDALIQRKAGAWTSRTPAQVKADMSIGVGDVSGLDENTRDVIGTALVAGSGVAVTVDDPGNTITIAVSGVVADAINDGTTTVAPSQNAVYDALASKQPLDADLTAIAALAPSDDALIQRKAGAWTSRNPAQVKADMSIGVGDVSGFDEQVRDVVGTALVAGSNVTITVNDGSDTITIASTGGGGGSAPITSPKVPAGCYLRPPINFMWSTPGGAYVWWVPVTVECPQAFNAIGLIVQSAGAGVTADFALVGDAGGYPGTVLQSSTDVPLTTAIEAVKVGAFSAISLPVGLVWMAVRIADPNNNCQVASAANTIQQPWGIPYRYFAGLPPYPNVGAHTSYGGGYKSATVLSSIPTTAPSGMGDLARNSPLPGLRAASW